MANVMDDEDCGVYCIMNTVTQKRYIGSSKCITKRWRSHVSDLKCGRHQNCHLQRSWTKHGANAFEFFVVEKCCHDSRLALETRYIKLWGTANPMVGYNLQEDASRGLASMSQETRDRISASKKGKPLHSNIIEGRRRFLDDEEKFRQAIAKGLRTKKLRGSMIPTDEQRRKNSAGQKGRIISLSSRRKSFDAQRIMTDKYIADAARLRLNGMLIREIASLANVSDEAVRSALVGKKHYAYIAGPIIRAECELILRNALGHELPEYLRTTTEVAG